MCSYMVHFNLRYDFELVNDVLRCSHDMHPILVVGLCRSSSILIMCGHEDTNGQIFRGEGSVVFDDRCRRNCSDHGDWHFRYCGSEDEDVPNNVLKRVVALFCVMHTLGSSSNNGKMLEFFLQSRNIVLRAITRTFKVSASKFMDKSKLIEGMIFSLCKM